MTLYKKVEDILLILQKNMRLFLILFPAGILLNSMLIKYSMIKSTQNNIILLMKLNGANLE